MSVEVGYIPYETTAKIITRGQANRELLEFLFPDTPITADTLLKFEEYMAGIFHDGIETGMGLSTMDPIRAIDAYRFGAEEGRDRLVDELNRLDKGDA